MHGEENARIGSLVLKWRTSAGLSQAALADALGTQQTTVSKLESGTYRLGVSQLVRILRACGIPLAQAAPDIERACSAGSKPLWERIDE